MVVVPVALPAVVASVAYTNNSTEAPLQYTPAWVALPVSSHASHTLLLHFSS